jgi:hypothetical protein
MISLIDVGLVETGMNRLGIVLLALLALGGCSVGMAMKGKEDPNIGALAIGQDRGIVLLNVGQPSQTLTTESGRTDVFQLQRGNQQSAGRAVGHAAMDVLTLGAWELIGTPIEGFAGEKFTLTVEYDKNDKVTKVVTAPGHTDF